MLRTGQIQDCVIDGDEEVRRRSTKPAREGRLAQKLDNVVANQPPELAR